jgi:hypothetical protein
MSELKNEVGVMRNILDEEITDEKELKSLRFFHKPAMLRRFWVEDVEFIIGMAQGLNACGVTDTTASGIFIVCTTDKKTVLKQYMGQDGAYKADWNYSRSVQGEIWRIAGMDKAKLEGFLSTRAHYNPFSDRRKRKKANKGDLKMRHAYMVDSFTPGRELSAILKRNIVHEYERFIVARIFGGASYARSRFSAKVYKLLSGPYGMPALQDKAGFYTAHLEDPNDFTAALRMVANRHTAKGIHFDKRNATGMDTELCTALSEISVSYLGTREPK